MSIFSVYLRDTESETDFVYPIRNFQDRVVNLLAILRILFPVIGVSYDSRLRVRWLFWNFYFGRPQ